MKKEMAEIQHAELNLIPLDYGTAAYASPDEIKVRETSLSQTHQDAIIRASNILIKKFIGECSHITKELKQCLKVKLGGVWIVVVAKGPMGVTISEHNGKELLFTIKEYYVYVLQMKA